MLPGAMQEVTGIKPGQKVVANALALQATEQEADRDDSRNCRFRPEQAPCSCSPSPFCSSAGASIAFHRLPVEAYPDVANNYAWVITQWPGRAAEEVEQQVTIPIENAMNGIPYLTHLRSVSISRAVRRDTHLRRRLGQCVEPAEGAGAHLHGQPSRRAFSPASAPISAPSARSTSIP